MMAKAYLEFQKRISKFIPPKDNWTPIENPQIKDVIEAFGGWATDAPIVFEIEAHRSMGKCLSSVLKNDIIL